MAPIVGWLNAALAHQRAGRPADAERVCREILSVDPGHAQTLHLLGLICQQTGRAREGAGLIRANMWVGFALCEALALIGIVVPFIFTH